jgi:hypothetical protein
VTRIHLRISPCSISPSAREIQGIWWALFHCEAIDSLGTQAIAHSRSLAASSATLRQAQGSPWQREARFIRKSL